MCLKAGTYKLGTRVEFKKTRMGTATRIITMRADPAATTKPVLDFSSQPRLGCGDSPVDKNIYGVDIGSDWTRVQGLEVSGANDTGILVQGAHDFVDNCVVHDAEDTGVLISSSSGFTGSGTYATITNTDSYHNHDERCEGANADGFGAKKGGGAGNVFDGCRSWDNADDGYDFYAWTDPVTVKNSWAFNMGATTAGAQSNGNGFKMGGNDVSAKHVMSNLFAFYNQGNGGHKADWGFTNNSNPASMTCTGCGAWNNAGGAFQGDHAHGRRHRQGDGRRRRCRQAQRRRQPARHHEALICGMGGGTALVSARGGVPPYRAFGRGEAARGAVDVDDLVLPGQAVPPRDQIVHVRVRAVAGAALDGDVPAVRQLVDVVLDAPGAPRFAHQVRADLRGDDLVGARAARHQRDAVEVDDHPFAHRIERPVRPAQTHRGRDRQVLKRVRLVGDAPGVADRRRVAGGADDDLGPLVGALARHLGEHAVVADDRAPGGCRSGRRTPGCPGRPAPTARRAPRGAACGSRAGSRRGRR